MIMLTLAIQQWAWMAGELTSYLARVAVASTSIGNKERWWLS